MSAFEPIRGGESVVFGSDPHTQLPGGVLPTSASPRPTPLGGAGKRAFDIVFALFALLALSPVFVVVAALVMIANPGPAVFRHERVGFNGQTFKCTKFRTMRQNACAHLKAHLDADPEAREEFLTYRKLRNDPRIIPFVGRFLRRSSLDELPQLIDVILGRMSLVGPRPVTEEELALYGENRVRYYSARPGITGLWQVSGRNNVSFEERVQFDKHYIQNWSFGQDVRILFRTVKVLANREGAC